MQRVFAAMREFCRRFGIDIQRDEFKRLGVTGNWTKPYLTMDFHPARDRRKEVPDSLIRVLLLSRLQAVMWSP